MTPLNFANPRNRDELEKAKLLLPVIRPDLSQCELRKVLWSMDKSFAETHQTWDAAIFLSPHFGPGIV